MLSLPPAVRIFVHREPTDLRRSFDSLAAVVSEVLRQDPFSGHLFAFFNRKRNKLKLLVWERGGFWLLYKRLEEGTFAPLDGEEIGAASSSACSRGWRWSGRGSGTSVPAGRGRAARPHRVDCLAASCTLPAWRGRGGR